MRKTKTETQFKKQLKRLVNQDIRYMGTRKCLIDLIRSVSSLYSLEYLKSESKMTLLLTVSTLIDNLIKNEKAMKIASAVK